jgi:hypothetical protein
MKADRVAPIGRNRLLSALQPKDFALLAPHLEDQHFKTRNQIEGLTSQISVAPFRYAVDRSTGIRDLIVRYNDAHMALIQQSAGCNALHHAEKRLCRWLLQTRDRSDNDVLSLTHEFLSQMLGVQRTSVTLIARQLQAEGLIRYRRGRVEIVDRDGLEKRACECYEDTRSKSEDVFSHPED